MKDKKPNILFLFADDQRFDTIGALGNDEIKTPNLDRLVESGTTLTNAYIPSGTSGAICMPSRAMLHTGRQLFSILGEGQEIAEDHVLLGETLQEAGYETFGTGKWHNGTRAYARSFTCGDEIFFGGMDDHWNVPSNHFDPTGKYEKRAKKVKNYMHQRDAEEMICDHVQAGKHSSELFTEAALKFIDGHDSENPFFAYVSYMAPHDPRTMPERFVDMYDPDGFECPKNFASYHHIEYGNMDCRDETLASYPRTEAETKVHILEYYGMISHLDEQVGLILDKLEEKGILDDTIIIFSGDNGLALGQHGLFGKQSHYEHSVHVPLIFAGPGIGKGLQNDALVYLLDIFPTICDLIGARIPETVEGLSMKTAIQKGDGHGKGNLGTLAGRQFLYFAYTDRIRSVKSKRYKLMQHVYDNKVTRQFFDLQLDPLEMSNLIESEEHQHMIELFDKKLYDFCDDWYDRKHPHGKVYWENLEKINQ